MDATQCRPIAVLHIPSILPTHLKQRIRDLPSEHTRTASISTSNSDRRNRGTAWVQQPQPFLRDLQKTYTAVRPESSGVTNATMPAESRKRLSYRTLGNSQLKVSPLCVGAMMFGDQTDESVAREIVAHARDHGVNFIDTADVYSEGKSESMVGAIARVAA